MRNSGNPFEDTEEANSVSMYYPNENQAARTGLPKIVGNNKGMFEKQEGYDKSRTKKDEIGRRKMGSYDINATKSIDRELKKAQIEQPNKDTIMTVDEAMYSAHRLEEMKMKRLDQSSRVSKRKDINIRVSTE